MVFQEIDPDIYIDEPVNLPGQVRMTMYGRRATRYSPGALLLFTPANFLRFTAAVNEQAKKLGVLSNVKSDDEDTVQS